MSTIHNGGLSGLANKSWSSQFDWENAILRSCKKKSSFINKKGYLFFIDLKDDKMVKKLQRISICKQIESITHCKDW